ncbi:MAG TPA: NUDIX domain-containing protein [Acidimicrobiia bacterium]|jgi:8-oxo-dGTP pyrophosphatase MutT (NUDIX family)
MSRWADEVRAAGAQPTGVPVRPAATVALLRNGDTGIEVLMGQRATKMDFHGGAWVFPGGRIDDEDYDQSRDIVRAARNAAAREAMEEAGVTVDADALVHFSNWTTPDISPKRYATWFFAGAAGADHDQAKPDGVESDAVRWLTPHQAMAERAAGEIELAPPQFVSMLTLSRFDTVSEALTTLSVEEPVDFQPRFHFLDGGGAIVFYEGDVAYDDTDKRAEPGPRHRLLMGREGWVYERA